MEDLLLLAQKPTGTRKVCLCATFFFSSLSVHIKLNEKRSGQNLVNILTARRIHDSFTWIFTRITFLARELSDPHAPPAYGHCVTRSDNIGQRSHCLSIDLFYVFGDAESKRHVEKWRGTCCFFNVRVHSRFRPVFYFFSTIKKNEDFCGNSFCVHNGNDRPFWIIQTRCLYKLFRLG